MQNFDGWLERATRGLASESVDRVRMESRQRYESARSAAISRGCDSIAAANIGITALGDPDVANLRYGHALLTATEAHVLRASMQDGKFSNSHSWFRFLLMIVFAAACVGAVKLLAFGWNVPGRLLLAFGIGGGIPLLISLLPVYTLSRGPIFRVVNWAVEIVALMLAFGPGGLAIYWLPALCIFQLIRSETIRRSIRRKLPVVQWPRRLYV